MSTNFIHPTSIIDPQAKIGQNNYIGPFCLIGPQVQIGDGNRLEAYVSIGTPAEHRNYFHLPAGAVNIGNNNVFREFVTITGGTEHTTMVGNNCSLLKGSQVGHDAILKNGCNLGCHATIGGHTIIEDGANLGFSAVVHQLRIVGAYAMIGMNSAVTKNILPFSISFGSPAEVKRLNRLGLQRAGISNTEITLFEDWFESQTYGFEHHQKLEHEFDKYLTEYFRVKSKLSKK